MSGPGLGDRAQPSLLTGRGLAANQADIAHQLLGLGEPFEVADLGAEPDRGQGVHTAQTPKPCDLNRPRRGREYRDDLALELPAAMSERVDRAASVQEC